MKVTLTLASLFAALAAAAPGGYLAPNAGAASEATPRGGGADAAISAAGAARGGKSGRTIRFRGEKVRVPAGRPVFRLDRRPRMCVRLDRRAVYLGTPGPAQRCPAGAKGRRRAILVDPAAEARASDRRPPPLARISAASGFVGLGFDACTAPSRRSMRAWDRSPYRAIGVYIGGINRACSQPNLTASWVREQVAAGWSLIPTYVGLQATTSSCTSCAKLTPRIAYSQGAAAAEDAVADARAIGIGPGSPIYNDMEGYARTSSATSSTLAFLSGWTARLHALGYVSGVYSSAGSGIADLVGRLGTGYLQPDHIWIANWDGRKTASDPYVPSWAWSERQRIRQYRGGHNETWGGVTINIDNNYVEGATAGASGPGDDPKGRLELAEAPLPGQVRVSGWAFDRDARRRPISIRVQVGGGKAGRGAAMHELGPVTTQMRTDIAASHRASGGVAGFDVTFPTAKVGRERVCAYAVNVGGGADRRLGCSRVGVRRPLEMTGFRLTGDGVRVRLACQWPAGTSCPGRVIVRALLRIRVAGASRRGRPATKRVRTAVARRPFRVEGGGSVVLDAPLRGKAKRLLGDRRKLRAKLLVAIPDGRVARGVTLRRGRGLPR